MKVVILLTAAFLALLMNSCNHNELLVETKKENDELKEELQKVQEELSYYRNSFMIPNDSLENYFSPIACGETTAKFGDSVEFLSALVLRKVPQNYTFEFDLLEGDCSITTEEDQITFFKSLNTEDNNRFSGVFTITHPDGGESKRYWVHHTAY